jgi:DNA polymerase-3 subunit delta
MIYLVYGDQYPLLSKRVKRLVKSILGDEIDEFSYVRINAKEIIVQDIIYECSLLPFLGKKVVRVDNPYFLTSLKEKVSIEKEQDYESFKKYILSTSNEDIVDLIFVLETSSVNKKSELYKAIEKNGKIIFEEGLNIEALHQTGIQYFARKGCNISSEALNLLLERVGDNVSLFIQEADKLCLYSKTINEDDVFKMVPIPLEQNAFNICEYLVNNKIADALKVFRDLLTLKEEPVRLLNLFASQFRVFSQVGYLYQVEKKPQDEIASILKMHPYRIKMLCRSLVKIKYQEVLNIMDKLFDIDTKIKEMAIDPITAIELFIINFNDIKIGNINSK